MDIFEVIQAIIKTNRVIIEAIGSVMDVEIPFCYNYTIMETKTSDAIPQFSVIQTPQQKTGSVR